MNDSPVLYSHLAQLLDAAALTAEDAVTSPGTLPKLGRELHAIIAVALRAGLLRPLLEALSGELQARDGTLTPEHLASALERACRVGQSEEQDD